MLILLWLFPGDTRGTLQHQALQIGDHCTCVVARHWRSKRLAAAPARGIKARLAPQLLRRSLVQAQALDRHRHIHGVQILRELGWQRRANNVEARVKQRWVNQVARAVLGRIGQRNFGRAQLCYHGVSA